MDIAVYVTAAIGGILLIFAGAFSSGGHRDWSIWTNCLSALFFVVSAFCWYQDKVWTADAANSSSATALISNDFATRIENLTFVLFFNREVVPEELDDKDVLIELTKTQSPRCFEFSVLATNTNNCFNLENQRAWGSAYHIRSRVLDGLGDYKAKTDFSILEGGRFRRELIIPLSTYGFDSNARPVTYVKDLDEYNFLLYAARDVAPLIDRVELLANSSFGFKRSMVLLSKSLRSSEWREGTRALKFEYDHTAVQKLISVTSGVIDLSNAKWVTREPLEPTSAKLYAFQ